MRVHISLNVAMHLGVGLKATRCRERIVPNFPSVRGVVRNPVTCESSKYLSLEAAAAAIARTLE